MFGCNYETQRAEGATHPCDSTSMQRMSGAALCNRLGRVFQDSEPSYPLCI